MTAPGLYDAQGRPLEPRKVLILALGGEGGGVLVQWLVDAGLALGQVVQSTSIPGVAQRTGATSYYLEWLPVEQAGLGGRQPVLCLSPMAGDLDLIISSELLEAARAAERGLADPARTQVIASSSRTFTVAEKMSMADGRLDEGRLRDRLHASARDLVLFDMNAAASASGTVLSAVMFGAIFASGVLPLTREACETVIRAGDRGTEASLRGFAAGADAVLGQATADAAQPVAPGQAGNGADDRSPSTADAPAWPPAVQAMLDVALPRLARYQDDAYARQYEGRVRELVDRERVRSATGGFAASAEAARTLALWMAYEDLIRVADLKLRRSRFASLEKEAAGPQGGVTRTWEFFKPGVDELVAVLPPALGRPLAAFAARRRWRSIGNGLQLETTGLSGLLMLRLLAGLRRFRRSSVRFAQEQALIARWHAALLEAMPRHQALALAIARAPALIRGYSDTHARGRLQFERVLERLIEAGPAEDAERAAAIDAAINAASADTAGLAFADAVGLPRPEPVAQPIRFLDRKRLREPAS